MPMHNEISADIAVPLSPVDTTDLPFDCTSFEAYEAANAAHNAADFYEQEVHRLELELRAAKHSADSYRELGYKRDLQCDALHQRSLIQFQEV